MHVAMFQYVSMRSRRARSGQNADDLCINMSRCVMTVSFEFAITIIFKQVVDLMAFAGRVSPSSYNFSDTVLSALVYLCTNYNNCCEKIKSGAHKNWSMVFLYLERQHPLLKLHLRTTGPVMADSRL